MFIEILLDLSHIIVAHRPSAELTSNAEITGMLRRHQVSEPAALGHEPAGCILLQAIPQLDISASRIRRMINAGQNPRYLVPDPVLKLINEHRLYRED